MAESLSATEERCGSFDVAREDGRRRDWRHDGRAIHGIRVLQPDGVPQLMTECAATWRTVVQSRADLDVVRILETNVLCVIPSSPQHQPDRVAAGIVAHDERWLAAAGL